MKIDPKKLKLSYDSCKNYKNIDVFESQKDVLPSLMKMK